MEVGAFAIIKNEEGHILCVRHTFGDKLWALPGGWAKPNEAPDRTLIRGVFEESKQRIHNVKHVGTYAKPYKNELVLNFTAEVQTGMDWKPEAGISEIGFYPADQLPLPMSMVIYSCIQDVVAERDGVYRVFEERKLITNKIEELAQLSHLKKAS